MTALPPQQKRAMRDAATKNSPSPDSLAQRWQELHERVARLAAVADLVPEFPETDTINLPAKLNEANQWQRELAWQGIEDIQAMMQPGLTALGTIKARGQNIEAPARSLQREFHAARRTIVATLEPIQGFAPID